MHHRHHHRRHQHHHLTTAVDTAAATPRAALQSAIRPYSNLRQFVRTSLTDVLIMNIVFYDCECRPRDALCSTGKVIYLAGHKENIVKSMRAPSSC